MMWLKVPLVLTILILINKPVFAQKCKVSTIATSNDQQQFVVNRVKGTVIDARTGLEWALCSTGQTWQSGNCLGTPLHFDRYSEAFASVEGNPLGADFRLPNIKELGSIVERSCNLPAIDLTIFPGTLNAVYYSSTPDNMINQHLTPSIDVKVIDFSDGSEFITDVNRFRYVRLVRTIDN